MLPTARKLQKLEPTKVIGEIPLLDSEKSNLTELTAPEVVSEEQSA